jgi:cold shock CspA family protein
VFCHSSGISDGTALREGDVVEYETTFDERKQKIRAVNVTGGVDERDMVSGGGRGRFGNGRSRGGSFEDRRGGGGGGGAAAGGPRQKGTACRWNPRGFGFIKPADGSEDVFCHSSGIRDGNALREGDVVEYEAKFDERQQKIRAANVTGGVDERDLGGGGGGGGGGYYDDRRGGYDNRRFDDRRGGRGDYGDRHFDDRRGGRGGYEERHYGGGGGGYDDSSRYDDRRYDDRRYDDRRYDDRRYDDRRYDEHRDDRRDNRRDYRRDDRRDDRREDRRDDRRDDPQDYNNARDTRGDPQASDPI